MERYASEMIPLGEIHPEYPYTCRWREPADEALKESVARRGVLEPVMLGGGLPRTLIAGHKRLGIAVRLGLDRIPALILPETLQPKELYLVSICSNWGQTWLDLDRAWILNRAKNFFGFAEQEILDWICPVLALPASGHVVEQYQQIMTLDPEVLQAVADGFLGFRGIPCFLKFPKGEQRRFVSRVAVKTALTASQLSQVMEWLGSLTQAGQKGLDPVLSRPEMEQILNHPQWDRRVKSEKFFEAVRKLRFPRLSSYETKASGLVHKILENSQDLHIEFPGHFEKKGFELRLKIKDAASLERFLKLLEHKKHLLNSLFDIEL